MTGREKLVEFMKNLTPEQVHILYERLPVLKRAIQEGWDEERLRQELKRWSEREGD